MNDRATALQAELYDESDAKPDGETSRRVGYALVGLGHIAQQAVLPAFENASGNSRLVALVSDNEPKRKALMEQYWIPHGYSYEQLEECLTSSEVQAVYLALPNHLHGEYALRAARAGVHILCEKPLAPSETECRRIIAACEESNVRLMVGYRLHFEPANLGALEWVQSGKLGEVRSFDSVFGYQVRPGNIRTLPEEDGGGPLWDIGVYPINAARTLFQAEPTEVFGWACESDDPRFAPSNAGLVAVMRFGPQRVATFTCSFEASPVPAYRIVGTRGELRLENAYDYEGNRVLVSTAEGRREERSYEPVDQFGAELIYFSECILEGKTPEPSGWEGLADVRVIEALRASIDLGRPVELEAFQRGDRPSRAMEMRLPAVEPELLTHVQAPHSG